MGIFTETAKATQTLDELHDSVISLVENEFFPECHFHIFEQFDDDAQDNQTIGSPDEIANEPKRQGKSYGGDRMIIVFVKIDDKKWIPGFFRKTTGEHGRVVNKKKDLNKRVTTDQLKKLQDHQLEAPPIKQLKDKYPTAAFYRYDPNASSEKSGEWALQSS